VGVQKFFFCWTRRSERTGSRTAFIDQVSDLQPAERHVLAQLTNTGGGRLRLVFVETRLIIFRAPCGKRLIEKLIDASVPSRLDGIFDDSLVFGLKLDGMAIAPRW
jgi:hypothetical protein